MVSSSGRPFSQPQSLCPRLFLVTRCGLPERAGANDHVRIGCIGAGRRAKDLREGLPSDAQIVAISDCNLPAAEAAAAAEKHQCRAYQDYRKMLESSEIDAVVIATPDHWHTLHAIHACQAGKDVYLEKPMTLTIREGRQLVTAVRKYQRRAADGQSAAVDRAVPTGLRIGAQRSPWTPPVGQCGELRKPVELWRFPAQEIPAGLDWDTWCGQTDVVPYNKDIQIPPHQSGVDLLPSLVGRRDDRLGRMDSTRFNGHWTRASPGPLIGLKEYRSNRRPTRNLARFRTATRSARVRWCVFATPTMSW